MGVIFFLGGLRARAASARAWAQARPALTAVLVLLVVYGVYLPLSGYHRFYFDSTHYWVYGQQFFKTGSFSLLSYTNSLRGYVFSLLLAPFAVAQPHLGPTPSQFMKPLGALTAALFYGALGPALWRAAAGPAAPVVGLGRRLVFGAVGFVVWRDYFNFPLSDFPALFALGVALWALLAWPGWCGAVLAGLAVGVAVNMRPVFQAALPFVGLLALWPGRAGAGPRWAGWARTAGFVVGLALVLAPQFYINAHNFGVRTPWVLAYRQGDIGGLLEKQLQWGLQYQKYESNVGPDYPISEMFFRDVRGRVLLAGTGLSHFDSPAQYLALALRQPVGVAGVWLRHLFNGLDVQYPTPYITRVYAPSGLLPWVNYTVLLAGALVLLRWGRRGAVPWRAWLVLTALLMPCMGALPVAMECRFLLPLQVVLSAAAAFGAHPVRAWRGASRAGRAAGAVGYLAFLGLAFAASARAQGQLEQGARRLFSTESEAIRRIPPGRGFGGWNG